MLELLEYSIVRDYYNTRLLLADFFTKIFTPSNFFIV